MATSLQKNIIIAGGVFLTFWIAAIIYSVSYDSNDTEYNTVYGIRPMDIQPMLSTVQMEFNYEMVEEETVTGANVYQFYKDDDHIKLTIKYEYSNDIGMRLLVLENLHHPDSSMSAATLFLAKEIVTLNYDDAQPDSALNWLEKSITKIQPNFVAGNGMFYMNNLTDGGTKLVLTGSKKD